MSGASFNTVWNELISVVDGLDPFSARKFVNRALEDIYNTREWGFLRARAVVQIPNAVTTGTVAVNQFDTAIQFSAAAAAILDTFGLNPPITDCQLKISAVGGAYGIDQYTPGGAAVLDRPYQQATNSTAAYTLLRCFVQPPADFLRFMSINDTLRSKPIMFGPRWTQQTIDRIDPQRTAGLEPYVFATFVYDDGSTQYEVWPNPTVGQTFLTEYLRRGTDLTDGDSLPDALATDLVLSRAKYRAYEYGASHTNLAWKANVFMNLMREANGDYERKLPKYIKQDRAQNPDSLIIPNDWWGYIWDASWMASHAPSWGLTYW